MIVLEILIHKQIEVLENIIPKWEDLQGNFREITIFQDISWLKSWWYYKSRTKDITPYIIEIKEKDKTIGIIPLYILPVRFAKMQFRILKPIGSELSDYLIPILSKEYLPDKLIKVALAKINEDESSWDCLEWGGVPEDSALGQVLANEQLLNPKIIKGTREDTCPYLVLNPDVELVKQKFSKKFLKEILYKERKLSREGDFTFSRVTSEQEIEPMMNIFFQLHCERWANTDTPSRFRFSEAREHAIMTAKNLFKSNLLYLASISLNDEAIVIHYGMDDGKRSYLYLHAINIKYSKFSPGSLLAYYLIMEACKSGHEVVDFLKGDEDYKEKWGTEEKYNKKYTIFNHSLRSFLYKSLVFDGTSKYLYHLIEKISHYSNNFRIKKVH